MASMRTLIFGIMIFTTLLSSFELLFSTTTISRTLSMIYFNHKQPDHRLDTMEAARKPIRFASGETVTHGFTIEFQGETQNLFATVRANCTVFVHRKSNIEAKDIDLTILGTKFLRKPSFTLTIVTNSPKDSRNCNDDSVQVELTCSQKYKVKPKHWNILVNSWKVNSTCNDMEPKMHAFKVTKKNAKVGYLNRLERRTLTFVEEHPALSQTCASSEPSENCGGSFCDDLNHNDSAKCEEDCTLESLAKQQSNHISLAMTRNLQCRSSSSARNDANSDDEGTCRPLDFHDILFENDHCEGLVCTQDGFSWANRTCKMLAKLFIVSTFRALMTASAICLSLC